MSQSAQITSLAALETFRSDLIVYLGRMRAVADEARGEVMRLRFWLQNDRGQFWEQQARLRRRRLEEAQAELFNARISIMQDSSLLQHMAVQRAQRALQEAEEKLAALKKWDRELETLAEPLMKPLDQLQGFLTTDMARAVAYLSQIIQTLEAYAEVLPPASAGNLVPPPDHPKAAS